MRTPESGYKILCVEEDICFAENLSNLLLAEKFDVKWISQGNEAVELAAKWRPDLILLDYKIPDLDGIEILEKLKISKKTQAIPVVMITETVSETTLAAFEFGAEDFLEKPFSSKILVKKIHRILNRITENKITTKPLEYSKGRQLIEFGMVRMDLGQYRVFCGNREVQLTLTQFKLLEFLISNADLALPRKTIISELKKGRFSITFGSIDVHIAGLRGKLGECGLLIEAVRGVGYRISLCPSVQLLIEKFSP